MISMKTGGMPAAQPATHSDFKKDDTHYVSAGDQKKFFSGQENIGETLNKIANANWVDPAKKIRTVGDNKLGKDAFMKLLLAQMKNQDPTNPMKSQAMAAQLAQFSSLEKLTNINTSLEGMRKDQKPDKNFEALALIGKMVSTDSSQISRQDTKAAQDIRFRLANDATRVRVNIEDSKGDIIRKLDFSNLKKGENELTWNGEMEDGTTAPTGQYRIVIEAKGSDGSKIFAQTKIEGIISGVNFTPHGPQVLVGKQAIDLRDIKSIRDLSTEKNQKVTELSVNNKNAAKGPKEQRPVVKAETKPHNEAEDLKRAKLAQGSVNDVAMTQGMINGLSKDGVKVGM